MANDTAFHLTCLDFAPGGAVPARHTCDGEDVSPALEWQGAPDDTVALALVMSDPDANGFVHWALFNLTATSSGGLPEGFSESPDAPPQATNDFGRVGYGGPCPPRGRHRYDFVLYALPRELDLTGAPAGREVQRAAEGAAIAQARLSGTYERRPRSDQASS